MNKYFMHIRSCDVLL